MAELTETRLAELEAYVSRMRPVGSCVWPPGEIPVFRETYMAWRELLAEVRRLRDVPHEQTAEHWRANAADEKRKKHHVSGLLAKALRERDEARTVLNDLLLTRQAHQEASNEALRLAGMYPDAPPDAVLVDAWDRTAEAELAYTATWDRARSLLAGEEKVDGD